MSKIIFLFTNSFPFGSGEQYINNEFKLLQNYFKEIFVVPISNFGEKRTSFEDVNLINLDYELNISKIKFFSNIFFYAKLLSSYNSPLSLNNFKSIHHAWTASDFILDFINDNEIEPKNVTIYSYWLYHSSLIAGFVKLKEPKIRCISRAHMGDVYNEIKPTKFLKLKLKNLDRVLTISDHARDYILKQFPNYSNKVFTSRLGVKDVGLNPSNLENNSFTIVSCSSVSRRKRILTIAEIIGMLNLDIKWIHFGDGEQMKELKKMIKKFPNNINVDLMGWVDNKSVLEYYKNHSVDLFINFSFQEGIPVSIMEALSFGIPVLAYDIYALHEIINSYNGVLLNQNADKESIAKELKKALKRSFIKEKIKLNWKENYSAKENYSRFIEKYLL